MFYLYLFNACSEKLFDKALCNLNEETMVNGVGINHLLYAEDMVLFSDSTKGLQKFIDL